MKVNNAYNIYVFKIYIYILDWYLHILYIRRCWKSTDIVIIIYSAQVTLSLFNHTFLETLNTICTSMSKWITVRRLHQHDIEVLGSNVRFWVSLCVFSLLNISFRLHLHFQRCDLQRCLLVLWRVIHVHLKSRPQSVSAILYNNFDLEHSLHLISNGRRRGIHKDPSKIRQDFPLTCKKICSSVLVVL